MTHTRILVMSLAAAALMAVATLILLPKRADGQAVGAGAHSGPLVNEQSSVANSTTDVDETWRVILDMQLRSERQCQLLHYVSVRRFRLAGTEAIEGRVRCKDNREFDFSRTKVHLKFDIRLCEPAVC